MLTQWWMDVRGALRNARRAPASALAIVLPVGLAIGAMITLISMVDASVIKPLRLPSSDRLVRVQLTTADRLSRTINPYVATPWDLYDAWRSEARSFERLGAVLVGDAVVAGNSGVGAERVPTVAVTSNIFDMLGARPLIGRAFAPAEDKVGSEHVVILSHRLWMALFGGDSAVVGRNMMIDNVTQQIVGVMPPAFRVPLSVTTADQDKGELFLPIGSVRRPLRPGARPDVVSVMGLLERGANEKTAIAELNRITMGHVDALNELQSRSKVIAEADLPRVVQIVPLRNAILGDARGMLMLSLMAVGLVVLIACTNAASLLLARAIDRRREFAVRRAIGANTSRLATQLTVESVIYTMIAAIIGTTLAGFAIPPLVKTANGVIPLVEGARLDLRLIGFVVLVGLGLSVLIGIVPASVVARDRSLESLKDGTSGAGRSRTRERLNDALVGAQVALAFTLMAVSGLLAQSFLSLTASYRGYEADNLVAMQFPVPSERYKSVAEQVGLAQRVLDAVARTPGVTMSAVATGAPALGGNSTMARRTDRGLASIRPQRAQLWSVTANYFEALGVPLLSGRVLRSAADSNAVVIDAATAVALFGRPNPIGDQIQWGASSHAIVVGVVGNIQEIRHDVTVDKNVRSEPLHLYITLGAEPIYSLSVVARTREDAAAAAPKLRQLVAGVDPTIPVDWAGSLHSYIDARYAPERFLAVLVIAYCALALVIAAAGIYATVSYATSRRTAEMGIRIALGARSGSILALGMRRAILVTFIGTAVGALGAAAATRSISHWLFEISPLDPWVFATGVLMIVAVAIVASGIPAYRATRIDPTAALRRE